MKTLVNRTRPILVLHSLPHTLRGYLLDCYTSWVFSPLFFPLPFLLCFCKLNYLNALFGSLKSRRFTLFPPWLPFLSFLFGLVFSGSFTALFQWHLLKFAQKKISLQRHYFSPCKRFMGAGRHPWQGVLAGRKQGRRERKGKETCWRSKGRPEPCMGSSKALEGRTTEGWVWLGNNSFPLHGSTRTHVGMDVCVHTKILVSAASGQKCTHMEGAQTPPCAFKHQSLVGMTWRGAGAALTCLVRAWSMIGACLLHACCMFGAHLVHTCYMLGACWVHT